jgi:hypothetical protein
MDGQDQLAAPAPTYSYQAPTYSWQAPLDDFPGPIRYASSQGRATAAIALVGLATLAYAAAMVASLSQLGIVDAARAGTLTPAQGRASDAAVSMFNTLATILFVVAAFAVIPWLYRTIGNVRGLTGQRPRHAPREAVKWWFIPLANYWMPYQVVRDTTHELSGDPSSATPVTAWWACYVAGALVGLAAAFAFRPTSSLDELQTVIVVSSAGLAIRVVSGILLVVVIARMERWSRWRARGLAAGSPADDAPGVATLAGSGSTAGSAWTSEPMAPPVERTRVVTIATTEGPVAPPAPPA